MSKGVSKLALLYICNQFYQIYTNSTSALNFFSIKSYRFHDTPKRQDEYIVQLILTQCLFFYKFPYSKLHSLNY